MLATLLIAAQLTVAPVHRPTVEVCFALDTTGSMASLIESAKEKIWFIANEIVRAPSRPAVRFCLMAFRDRGDAYVTRHTDLSEDLDQIHAVLWELRADGGGDQPEAVNQALLETVRDSSWSNDALKLIFLVGDAPPHEDYDEPQYETIAAMARQRGIVINPVLLGRDRRAERAWHRIAEVGGGQSSRIDVQPTAAPTTPMDQDLAVLGQRLDRLVIPYGPSGDHERLRSTGERVAELSEAAAAERLAFKVDSGQLTDRVDLIAALEAGTVNLADLEPSWLPASVRSMTAAELNAHLGDMRADRHEIRAIIESLVRERQGYLASRRSDDGFDSQVSRLVLDQLAGHLAR